MKIYTVYATMKFKANVEADSLAQAQTLAAELQTSDYDEVGFTIDEVTE